MFPYRIVFEVKSVNKGLFLVKMAGSIGNLWPTKIYQVVLRFSLSFYSEDSRRPSNVQSTFVLIEIASTSIRQMSTWDRTHVKSYESQTSSVYGSHWFSVRALYFFYRSKHGLVQSRMVGLAWFHERTPGTTLLE